MRKNLVTAAATAGLIVTAFGASANAQEPTYTVHKGDSLWKISNSNNMTIDQLKTLNHLSQDEIYVNQKLSLTYTVKAGDTLWAIAKTYGTTVSELKRLNGLTSDLIQIGQQLQLSNLNSTDAASGSTYVVQSGDTLSVIGTRFNLSTEQIKAINQLTSDTIYPGQTLKVKGLQSHITQYSVPETSTRTAQKPAAAQNAKIAQRILAKSTAVEAARTVTPSVSNVQKPVAAPKTPAAQKPVVSTNKQVTQKILAKSYAVEAARTTTPSGSTAAARPAAKPVAKPAAPVNTASSANAQAIISEAEKYIGTPYVWGGNTPSGFDCSGYIKYVFNKFGISIPRTTEAEYAALRPVSSPRAGDLVFFATYTSGPSHVGIYLGNNKFISAESNGVKISDITLTYWKTRYLGARTAF